MKGSISPLCTAHKQRKRKHGHPTGKLVPGEVIRREREYVENFLKTHRDHPGVVNSFAVLDRMLSEATFPDVKWDRDTTSATKTRHWLALMNYRGATGRDIVFTLILFWVIQEQDPRLFKDNQHFIAQVTNAVLELWDGKSKKHHPLIKGPRNANLCSLLWREGFYLKLIRVVGPLPINAAREIISNRNAYCPTDKTVPGVDEPFSTAPDIDT